MAVLAAWMILSCISVHAAQPFELYLLDVGQGQSVLIEADGHYSGEELIAQGHCSPSGRALSADRSEAETQPCGNCRP